MKLTIFTAVCLVLFSITFYSCRKDDSKSDFGMSKIYMPQSINTNGLGNSMYPVPHYSDGINPAGMNYVVDTVNKKVNVMLGTYLSGTAKGAYTVDVQTNSDTVQQLIANGTLGANYVLMPAGMYSLPEKINVPGTGSATFYLSIDIAQLKLDDYRGKHLALAVKLNNPSNYVLDTFLSTTIIDFNVDAVVLGPSEDVTVTYIRNPGKQFTASTMFDGRWGALADWSYNEAGRPRVGFGNYSNCPWCGDGDPPITLDIERWGSPEVLNAKLYQTISLPAGNYTFDPTGNGGTWQWDGAGNLGYVVVAPGADTLPDFNSVAGNTAVLYKTVFNRNGNNSSLIDFELEQPMPVTIGFIVNLTEDYKGFKTKGVSLLAYPKHL